MLTKRRITTHIRVSGYIHGAIKNVSKLHGITMSKFADALLSQDEEIKKEAKKIRRKYEKPQSFLNTRHESEKDIWLDGISKSNKK